MTGPEITQSERTTTTMTTYVYAMTRTGEAQHAVEMYEDGSCSRTTACGRKGATFYGSPFPGERGIQHPWKCDSCDRAIRAAS